MNAIQRPELKEATVRAILEGGSPGNVVRKPQHCRLEVTVRDADSCMRETQEWYDGEIIRSSVQLRYTCMHSRRSVY